MTGRDPHFATLQLAMAPAIAVSMFTLGGGQERQYNRYLHARDTITLSAGDAVAHNRRAIHTIDPWPAYARKAEHSTNGKRIYLDMTRYQENKSLEPEGLSTSKTFENSDGARRRQHRQVAVAAAQPSRTVQVSDGSKQYNGGR